MLYYRVMITREVITGLYLHTYYMILVMTKVGQLVEYPQVIPMWGLKGQVAPSR